MMDTNELVSGIKACKRVPKHPTVAWLKAKLEELDKGVLYAGSHEGGEGEFCALEFVNVIFDGATFMDDEGYEHIPLNDEPDYLPDLRGLNDHPRWKSNGDRTKYLLPVIAALWGCEGWSTKRQLKLKKKLVALDNELIGDENNEEHRLYESDTLSGILSDLADLPSNNIELHKICSGIVSAARSS